MRRHTLALCAIGLLACVGDSPWETARDWNGSSAWFQRNAEVTDHAGANVVDWNTPFVRLHADDFRIVVAGKTFLGRTSAASLSSDPGTPEAYTTFERTWVENGVEMRLFIYFYSDGTEWWAGEIRIYNGQPTGDWYMSTGEWFRRPLEQSFTGDLELTFDAADSGAYEPGHLTMRGLEVQAFATPPVCLGQSSTYTIQTLYPTIELTTAPNTGFGVGVWLRDSRCERVVDNSDFVFAWTVEDPTIVELTTPLPELTNAQLRGLAPGETTLGVAALRRSDKTVVARATMDVVVNAAQGN